MLVGIAAIETIETIVAIVAIEIGGFAFIWGIMKIATPMFGVAILCYCVVISVV